MNEKMDREASSRSGGENCGELQCVARLEITRPKPVGFLCGSIPVPTDNSFHAFTSALLPSTQRVIAPRYRMLPTETDLNSLPVVPNLPDKVLPIGTLLSTADGELSWGGDAVSSDLSRRCDALAVSGLVEYGDEIDVIAPADILKQIFRMPYSKARLSIAVRRIGKTLVLNTGPDLEEGEKLVRRHKNQSKCAEQSLFLNFAMHSVRMEACDCPPSHRTSVEGQPSSSFLSKGKTSQFVGHSEDANGNEGLSHHSDYPQVNQDGSYWKRKKNEGNNIRQPVRKASHVGEKSRSSVKESEKHKRIGNDGFLRVLFWQFHHFRMLLGSDLLLFSNEKYAAVSLHLWDVSLQVTPLTWLEAWLDNIMASVPELAICYHQNGVVQGYELLKTDDIFLLKGVSEDGTPAFHPHVVQQNGLSVLRFLQENCKQDPGAYWLYKSAGEDVIQLFDLSVIPKHHSVDDCDDISSSLPSFMRNGRSDPSLSLGTLLYRIAHRLSLSIAPTDRARCASYFRKCLEFLDQSDHMVVRAIAHEQFARLLLTNGEDVELITEKLPVECEVTVPIESVDPFSSSSEFGSENVDLPVEENNIEKSLYEISLEASVMMTVEANISTSREQPSSCESNVINSEGVSLNSESDETLAVCTKTPTSAHVVKNVVDPISSKLAAVHHVSQAIKSLRWMRQLQHADSEFLNQDSSTYDGPPSSINSFVCRCGDADCIEVCDIREWLPTSKIDGKLWKLILLLGESYLALGQAYVEDNQLHQALKVVEVACSVYGSMPQQMENTRFISSMVKLPSPANYNDRKEMISYICDAKEVNFSYNDNADAFEHLSSTYIFWAKAWTLVGDVYVEYHFKNGEDLFSKREEKYTARELRMSTEVVKEVQRLKKKLGQFYENCSSCSLVNCSCQSDRATSGSSASSSAGDRLSVAYGRKHAKRSYAKGASNLILGSSDESSAKEKVGNRKSYECTYSKLAGDPDTTGQESDDLEKPVGSSFAAINSRSNKDSMEMKDTGSKVLCQDELASKQTTKTKNGGIFKYLCNYIVEDVECYLSTALNCYEEAKKALVEHPTDFAELQSLTKKIGWVCNETGRIWLERKELHKAELAFSDAINAFREVSDHTNIILINCNFGHGRRALAEEMVSKLQNLKSHEVLHNAFKQALEAAKFEYTESIRYYVAAKSELNAISEEVDLVPNHLKSEVYTQLAHTYLRLGMLLANEDTTAKVYENEAQEDRTSIKGKPIDRRAKKEMRKHEISANEAIREALSIYESLGELRKQEAAYAFFQLASYQRDCCFRFLQSDLKKQNLRKVENNILVRLKQYASLAERNWLKAINFYGPNTHPTMYLTILMERSALSMRLYSALHSNTMLDSALSRMLEGRHIPEQISASFRTNYPELNAKFWGQLQMLLKKMLANSLAVNTNKSAATQSNSYNRCGDSGKLRELYKMSLKSTELSQLNEMHNLWVSESIPAAAQ